MRIFTQLSKIGAVTAFMLLVSNIMFAASFTAVASGSWSSSATWGGTAPSNNITLDQITIPGGLNVMLDNTVTFNGLLSSLNVTGTLSSNASAALIVNMGTVTGAGSIIVNSLVLNAQSAFTFTGTVAANTMTSAAANLQLAADLTVHESMTISAGVMNIVSGGMLDVDNNGTVIITGGLISLGGGNVGFANVYNVIYSQGSSSTGLELSGSGLQNVTVDVGSNNAVTLGSDLLVDGTFNLTSGNLILSTHNLTVNGSLVSSGNGTITSTQTSNITLNTTTGTVGTMTFTALGADLNNLSVNVGNGNAVTLGSDLTVHGSLHFTTGSINANNNDIEIATGGTITGSGNNSYVITGADGSLGIDISSGGSTFVNFPVGTSTTFLPAGVQLNNGSASTTITVGVTSNVMTEGTTGNDLSISNSVVDATWFIESGDSANVDANIQLMWNSALEVNGFNQSAAYVAHYTDSAWEMASNITAATAVNGMFMLQANNVTSFSPFAVFDQQTPLAIGESNTADDIILNVFPNPATENISINFNGDVNEIVNMDIVDVQGRVVGNYKLTGNGSVSISQLPAGNYFIRFFNKDFSVVKKMVKL